METKTYSLKSKSNETINMIESYTYDFALKYFSTIKRLDEEKLLKIYKIENDGQKFSRTQTQSDKRR